VTVARLGANRYGKAEVRVVRITRGEDGDVIRDRNVSISLSGDLADTHLTGNNAKVLTTDTQKNTVNAFAQTLGDVEAEVFALALARHFVAGPITRARVAVEEYGWARIGSDRHGFQRNGDLIRTTSVVHDVDLGTSVVSGLRDLTVLKTTDSEFHGFPQDEYTTLPETTDRMLATSVTASWRYRGLDVDWAGALARACAALLDAFAGTYSYSLQQTLFAMGSAIVDGVPEICEVRLSLPNKHHFLVDLAPFGLTNDNEVYFVADRPYGLIEGTVLADDAPDDGLAWT
jgi:urate oxidase